MTLRSLYLLFFRCLSYVVFGDQFHVSDIRQELSNFFASSLDRQMAWTLTPFYTHFTTDDPNYLDGICNVHEYAKHMISDVNFGCRNLAIFNRRYKCNTVILHNNGTSWETERVPYNEPDELDEVVNFSEFYRLYHYL